MATILIKNVPEEILKELKRLKVELCCKTWADLISVLAVTKGRDCLTEKERQRMKKGVEGLLSLSPEVTRMWESNLVFLKRREGPDATKPHSQLLTQAILVSLDEEDFIDRLRNKKTSHISL